MVSGETDIKIFIEHHRSTNATYPKEQFQSYDDNKQTTNGPKPKNFSQSTSAPTYNQDENGRV